MTVRTACAGAILVLLPLGCGTREPGIGGDPRRAEVEVDGLRRLIIPPKGTVKAEVDAVFGAPQEANEAHGRSPPGDNPMSIYQLLDPGPSDCRAYLYVTLRDDRVVRAGINHACETKGRPVGPKSAEEHAEMEREADGVLRDLLAIKAKFADRLSAASWNAGP